MPHPPVGRTAAAKAEESPGSIRMRRRITSGGGDPRETATESKPPRCGRKAFGARVKGCGKSAPRRRQRRRHGKPRREQNRIGATRGFARGAFSVGPVARVGCLRRPATGVPEEWPSRRGDEPRPYRTRLTGRLALLPLLVQTRAERIRALEGRGPSSSRGKAMMLRADKVIPAGQWSGGPADTVVLDFDERYRRRLVMTGVGGLDFLLDLGEAAMLRGGDGLRLEDGRIVEVVAAPEPLAEIRAADALALTRVAWHLGNRHLPTELMPKALRIRRDSVIEAMAQGLGARVILLEAPFNPEGGAYVKAEASAAKRHDHDHHHDRGNAHDRDQERHDNDRHGHAHGSGPGHADEHHHGHDHGHDRPRS